MRERRSRHRKMVANLIGKHDPTLVSDIIEALRSILNSVPEEKRVGYTADKLAAWNDGEIKARAQAVAIQHYGVDHPALTALVSHGAIMAAWHMLGEEDRSYMTKVGTTSDVSTVCRAAGMASYYGISGRRGAKTLVGLAQSYSLAVKPSTYSPRDWEALVAASDAWRAQRDPMHIKVGVVPARSDRIAAIFSAIETYYGEPERLIRGKNVFEGITLRAQLANIKSRAEFIAFSKQEKCHKLATTLYASVANIQLVANALVRYIPH